MQHTFKTKESFQKYLQTRYKRDDTLDCVKVAGIVYTMTSYDEAGRSLEFHSKNDDYMQIETSDRYKKGFIDAIVI